jgi:hypothetical protein
LAQALESVLKERVHAVFGRAPTEAELRKLFEEAEACSLILNGQLERAERLLAELASDPNSSLADIAKALRRVHELRRELDELLPLLVELERQSRSFRASWIRK